MRIALLVLAVTISFPLASQAQDRFEGMVEFEFDYLNVPERLSNHVESLSSGMTVFSKGEKCRKQQSGSTSGSQVVVTDYASTERFILMDLFGKRIALMENSKGAGKTSDENPVSYEYTEDTKEIAGKKCYRVVMRDADQDEISEMWINKEFTCAEKKYAQLGGFPMEFTLIQNDMRIRATAVRVENMRLGEALFNIPPGYEQMDSSEFETFIATLDP